MHMLLMGSAVGACVCCSCAWAHYGLIAIYGRCSFLSGL